MKKGLVIAAIINICFSVGGRCQDVILKKDGDIIDAKVISITPTTVNIKLLKDLNGPEISIPKAEVLKIRYHKGTYDIFRDGTEKIGVDENGNPLVKKRVHVAKVKKTHVEVYEPRRANTIAFAPFDCTGYCPGFSLSYERVFDKKGLIGFYCPIVVNFFNIFPFTSASNFFSGPMYYINPGFKFYMKPKGNPTTRVFVNPQLVLGYSPVTPVLVDRFFIPTYKYTNQDREVLGLMICLGGDKTAGKHFYFGYNLGLGVNFMKQQVTGPQTASPIVQVSFRLGYAFGKKL